MRAGLCFQAALVFGKCEDGAETQDLFPRKEAGWCLIWGVKSEKA